MNERTTLKIERKTSPNGRYEFTLSFLMNGEWHPTNYAHSAWVLQEWARAEIERGTYTGPVVELAVGKQFLRTLPPWIDGGRTVVVTITKVLVPFGRDSYNGHDCFGNWMHSDGEVREGKFYLRDVAEKLDGA